MKKTAFFRKALLYLLLGALLYFLPFFCRTRTDGFSIARITSYLPKDMRWRTPPAADPGELECALNQPYRYLGSGGQCFAFVSQDNRYVIKFFKTRFIPFGSLTFQTLPFFSEKTRERKMQRALFKLRRDFNSYTLASSDLKEETGIIYMHLNKTKDLHKKLLLTDKLSIAHALELDQFEFCVQRRAELAYPYIASLIQQNLLEKAKSAIGSLMALSLSRCKKGIYDEDAKMDKNYGFLDDKPVFIDIGRFVQDPSRKNPQVYQKDLQDIRLQLSLWIESNYPDLVSYLNEALFIDET